MIKKETLYHITLTTYQFKELYELLHDQKDQGRLTPHQSDLMELYIEMGKL